MKDIRASAFNYAFVALLVMVAVYAIFLLFGGMPSLTVGGYAIETLLMKTGTDVPISIIVPRIESTGFILIVPMCVFALRYVFVLIRASGLQVFSMWNNDDWILPVIVVYLSIVGLLVRYPSDSLGTLMFMSAVWLIVAVGYTIIFNIIALGIRLSRVYQARVLIRILVILYGASMVHVLIHIFFITLYRLEWLLFLPGIAIVLFVLETVMLTFVPCIISIIDRLVALVCMIKDAGEKPERILGY
jgi:hypothetical protein